MEKDTVRVYAGTRSHLSTKKAKMRQMWCGSEHQIRDVAMKRTYEAQRTPVHLALRKVPVPTCGLTLEFNSASAHSSGSATWSVLLNISATTTTLIASRLARSSCCRRDIGPRETTTPAATSPVDITWANRTFSCFEKGGAQVLDPAAAAAVGGAARTGDGSSGEMVEGTTGYSSSAGSGAGPSAAGASGSVRAPAEKRIPHDPTTAVSALAGADPDPASGRAHSETLVGPTGGPVDSTLIDLEAPLRRHRSGDTAQGERFCCRKSAARVA